MVDFTKIMVSPHFTEDRIAEIIIISLIWISGLILNLTAALVFYRKGSLRTNGHRFLLSMIISNLTITLFVISTSLYGITMENPLFTPFCCSLSAFGTVYFMETTMFSVLLIGWDRFLACVGNPLQHSRRMSFERSRILIIAAWTLPAVFVAPVFLEGENVIHDDKQFLCSVRWSASAVTKVTAGICTIGTFLLPFTALTVIYTKVYISARSTASVSRKNVVYEFRNHLGTRRSMTIELSKTRSETRLPALRQSSYTSLQAFLTGQDSRKTAHIIIWIILSVIVCGCPFYFLMLLEAFFTPHYISLQRAFHRTTMILFFLSATVLNPLIYIFSNSGLRRDVRRLFMKRAEIRRQCSLQLHGSFRSHSLLQVQKGDSDKCFSRQSFDVGTPTLVTLPGMVLPAITCNGAEIEGDTGERGNAEETDKLLMPEYLGPHKTGSSRSLSRKSVSFVEEENPFENVHSTEHI